MVILLTGPSGSGKTTIAVMLAGVNGWARVAEDEIWPALFGRDRGRFGSSEHREKRRAVHAVVFERVLAVLGAGDAVVVEATVHESPPEAFLAYTEFFADHDIEWRLIVLLPRLEVAVARDASRASWHLGAEGVASLYAKFTGEVFDQLAFLDNSDETAGETLARVLRLSSS